LGPPLNNKQLEILGVVYLERTNKRLAPQGADCLDGTNKQQSPPAYLAKHRHRIPVYSGNQQQGLSLVVFLGAQQLVVQQSLVVSLDNLPREALASELLQLLPQDLGWLGTLWVSALRKINSNNKVASMHRARLSLDC
jgi:hypothetical protein